MIIVASIECLLAIHVDIFPKNYENLDSVKASKK